MNANKREWNANKNRLI